MPLPLLAGGLAMSGAKMAMGNLGATMAGNMLGNILPSGLSSGNGLSMLGGPSAMMNPLMGMMMGNNPLMNMMMNPLMGGILPMVMDMLMPQQGGGAPAGGAPAGGADRGAPSGGGGAGGAGGMSELDALKTLYSNMSTLDTAAGIGNKDNKIGNADFNAILKDPMADPQLKEAVQMLQDNPEMKKMLNEGGVNGNFIAKEELMQGIQKLSNEQGADAARGPGGPAPAGGADGIDAKLNMIMDLLKSLMDQIGGGQGGPGAATDTSAPKGPAPGADQPFMSKGEALQTIMDNMDSIEKSDNGRSNGKIHKSELEAAALNHKDPAVREAATMMLADKTLFNNVNGQTGSSDKRLTMEELQGALTDIQTAKTF